MQNRGLAALCAALWLSKSQMFHLPNLYPKKQGSLYYQNKTKCTKKNGKSLKFTIHLLLL